MYNLWDPFDAPSGIWVNETGVIWDGNPDYITGPDAGAIRMNAPNMQGGRYVSTFEITDEVFTAQVRLRRWWQIPSDYNGSNVRAWVGIYQSGAATQFIDDPNPNGYGKSHKLWLGTPAARISSIFDEYTHYACDLNELFNWSNNQTGDEWVTLRFIRVGNNIEVYKTFILPEADTYTLWRTFAIERPDDPLFFEFVEIDWHNMANAYTEHYYFLYNGIGTISGSTSFMISGALISSLSPLNIINRLSKVSDYDPQLLGTFTNSVNSVTIRLWELSDGQNIVVPITVSGCSQVGDTERWIWSTSNLPVYTGYRQQFFYTMTADNNETSSGQFFLDLPENPKGMYPISMGEALL